MSRPVKDALICEILDYCAGKPPLNGENEPMGVGRYPSRRAGFHELFSPIDIGSLSLKGKTLIAPLSPIGESFAPDGETERFYLSRSGAALLTTAPVPAGFDGDPFLPQRWLPLNERMHARGARMLFQIALDGSTPQTVVNMAVRALPGGFDGICLNAREHEEELHETVCAIRERLGKNLPILCRVSLSHAAGESGFDIGNGKAPASLSERYPRLTELARAGVDAFEVTLGGPETPWLLSPSERAPAGCFAEAARALKALFRFHGISAAVIASGRLAYPKLAENLLESGMCDMISLDGAGIEDPDWIRKVRNGRCGEIAPLPLPAIHAEPGAERVAVVGGGLRGILYALDAVDRGMTVDLFEARERLGGRLALFPSRMAYEEENRLSYLLRELEKRPSIRVRLGTRATGGLLRAGSYDRIVFACRAAAVTIPNIPGWGEIKYTTAEQLGEALSGKWRRKHVAVLGSDALACDIAWALQAEGLAKKVTLITQKAEIMPEKSEADLAWFRHFFLQRGGSVVIGCELLRMRRHSVVYRESPEGREIHLRCDRIVLLEEGPVPLRLYQEAIAGKIAPEIILL